MPKSIHLQNLMAPKISNKANRALIQTSKGKRYIEFKGSRSKKGPRRVGEGEGKEDGFNNIEYAAKNEPR